MFSAKSFSSSMPSGGDFLSAWFGNYSQKKSEARQFEYNKRLANLQWDRSDKAAELNRGFQERMSSTAYQRAMADMRAGGLNPILAYTQGGASSPSGSMPNYASPGSVNTRGDAGVRAASAYAAIRNMREQNLNLAAQRGLTDANTAKVVAETDIIRNQGERSNVITYPFRFINDLVGDPEPIVNSARSVLQRIGEAFQEAGRRARENRDSRDRRIERNQPAWLTRQWDRYQEWRRRNRAAADGGN